MSIELKIDLIHWVMGKSKDVGNNNCLMAYVRYDLHTNILMRMIKASCVARYCVKVVKVVTRENWAKNKQLNLKGSM